MYLICLIFVNHVLTTPASDKSDKSVSLYFRFGGNHRSHRLKGSFSLALVIEISKIPNICGFIFFATDLFDIQGFSEIYQHIEKLFFRISRKHVHGGVKRG